MTHEKVIEFPKSKIVREVTTSPEEIEKFKTKGKQNYADSMSEEIAAGLLIELENFGVDTMAPEFNKDFLFMTDVVKCLIYRNMGLEHSLQSFIDENVRIVDLSKKNDEEVVFSDNDDSIG